MKHVLITALGGLALSATFAQTGTVADFFKISESAGDLGHNLAENGRFGQVFETSQPHIIVSSAPEEGNGALYVIDLGEAGAATPPQRISADDFSLFDEVTDARFGTSVLDLGDRDGDSSPDFLVGATGMAPGGGFFVLLSGAGSPTLQAVSLPAEWPQSPGATGDFLASDGSSILIASSEGSGAIWSCTLNATPALVVQSVLDENTPLLAGKLEAGDRFGSGLSTADMNGDGHSDILCGAPGDDDQDSDFGAVYILYRNAEKAVTGVQKLSRLEGDFGGLMNTGDEFGVSVRCVGDLDENGSPDLIVGAPGDDDGGTDVGAVWVLFMRSDGLVFNERKINRFEGNFSGGIQSHDGFGARLALIGDHNGDGTMDFVAGAPGDDDGGSDKGALYAIMIDRCPAPSGFFEYETEGPDVHFTAEGGPGYTYIWNFDDGGYSQDQNPTHTYASNGTFTVCLAINNDCGGDNYCRNVSVTNVGATGVSEATTVPLKIFPNPTSDVVQIRSDHNIRFVCVRDITGKVLYRSEPHSTKAAVSLASQPRGLFFMEVCHGDRVVTKKVEKH